MRPPQARHEHFVGASGNGPKGYQRSDARLFEEVCEVLADHGDIDASEIEVTIDDGDVILRGTVRSRWARFYAEDLAAGVPGVRDVVNELRVARGPGGGELGGPTSDGGAP
jgi:osmotically-inducible protein OsmY